MHPDPENLMKQIDLEFQPIGLYDAPDPAPFEPLIRPGKGNCVFEYFKNILDGQTLLLTKEQFGCPGAGNGLLGLETFPKEDLVKFLVEQEGLKASKKLMLEWVDSLTPYSPQHGNILIGSLKPDQYDHLKSVTFIVNPDQLSAVMTGAQYFTGPEGIPPVISPFGSGCSLLVRFDDLNIPQAILGSSDMAMRKHLEADQLFFTVTRPMFEQLCKLDENSFLYKQFWGGLRKSRELAVL